MSLAAFGVLVANMLVNYGEKASPYHGRAAVGGIALMCFVPLLVLWLFGSVVHRFQVGAAKLKSAAMAEAQKKAGVPFVPAASRGSQVAGRVAAHTDCAMCRQREAVTACLVHGQPFCLACWELHIRTTHVSGADSAAAGA